MPARAPNATATTTRHCVSTVSYTHLIVFGGDKKLAKLIEEIDQLFPLNKGISVQSECPIGLIGDDIEAIAKKTSAAIGKPVVPVRCEGFRGVSQSLGHHIANDTIRDWVLDKRCLLYTSRCV